MFYQIFSIIVIFISLLFIRFYCDFFLSDFYFWCSFFVFSFSFILLIISSIYVDHFIYIAEIPEIYNCNCICFSFCSK